METIGSGGVEQLRYTLSQYLDKDRFEQKIVCTQALGVLPGQIEQAGVEVIPIGLLKTPFQWTRHSAVLKVVRSFKPHIIHGAVFEGVSLAIMAGRLGKVPGIIIEETSDPVDRSWRGNALMRLYARMSDRVIAVSDATGNYIRDVIHIREPKLRVIDNGVTLPEYPMPAEVAALKRQLGIQEGDFVVGSVGRLFDDHKKVSDLIRAVALLRDRGVSVKLLVVGDGPDKSVLEALCRTLDVQSSVIFAGYQGNTAPFFACMDVFALASQREAFGLVLVEAMLFRLPVVATAVGGVRYVVDDHKTGLLVPKNDPRSIAEGLETLYHDPARRSAFGNAGWEKAMRHYTADIYVEKIRQLYLELAGEKGVPL
jgi:glycosyltransferase involved in cell wall biosynthesis